MMRVTRAAFIAAAATCLTLAAPAYGDPDPHRPAIAALLPRIAVPTVAAVTVPPTPSPATVWTVSPTWGMMATQLQGSLCQSPRTCTEIHYPPSTNIPQGVSDLNDAIIGSTSDPTVPTTIVFGYSEGAEVAGQWVKQHAGDPTAPDPGDLTFVLIGNPTRAYGGNLVETAGGAGNPAAEAWPQSQYQVIDIAREYEGTADYPNNPSSPYYLLAVANAWAGWWFMHDTYSTVDMNDPANAVWTVGNTTYVLVPTANIPLLEGLRGLGLTALANALNTQLKAQVDHAYNRPVPFPTTTQPAPAATTPTAASAFSVPVISDPTVAPQNTTVLPVKPPRAQAVTTPSIDSTLSASIISDPTVMLQNTTVPLSPAPAVQTEIAPSSAAPENANGKGRVVADTATTTTPGDPTNVLGAVRTITPPAAERGLDNASAAKQSTTAPTTHATATSTTSNENKAVTGKAGENQSETTSEIARPTPAQAAH